jgi:hypothetical protein
MIPFADCVAMGNGTVLTSLNFTLACMHRKQGNNAGTNFATMAVGHLTGFNVRKKVPHAATIIKSTVWTTQTRHTMVQKLKVKLDGFLSFGSVS